MRIAQVAPLARERAAQALRWNRAGRFLAYRRTRRVRARRSCSPAGNSRTSAKLVPAWPTALRLNKRFQDRFAGYAALMEAVARNAGEFDVIHCHSDWLHLPVLQRSGVPLVTTLHGRLDIPHVREVTSRFPKAGFVSISDNQRIPLPNVNWLGTVHHGMPTDCLHYSPVSERHLVFLGRITPEKGPDVAVRWAKAAGLPLRIAAKILVGRIAISESA